jgi:hypothetical protein
MKIDRNRAKGTMKITQERHVDDLLDRFGMKDAKTANTPMPTGTVLTKEMCPVTSADKNEMRKIPYRELVGSLLYLSTCTRPDIAFAVGRLCRYMDNPGTGHWKAAKHIVKYLKGTRNAGLLYQKTDHEEKLSAYVDADYAEDKDTRKSTTGYIFHLGSCSVAWNSTLQPIVTTSTTYAEYVAMSREAQENAYLRAIMKDLGINLPATLLQADNQGAIFLSENEAFHKRTKHIDVRYHYIREQVSLKKIKIEYVPTKDNVADALTKALAYGPFATHRGVLLGQDNQLSTQRGGV